MELVTLDKKFQVTNLIDNFESLIWTERYNKAGDFQIVSSDIDNIISKMPLDAIGRPSYVKLRESNVVMFVERAKIESDANGIPKITVTGRSFEAVALSRRTSTGGVYSSGAYPPFNITASKESDAAFHLMRTILGDVSRKDPFGLTWSPMSPANAPGDAIPEIHLRFPTDYLNGGQSFNIKPQELYQSVIDLLTVNSHGIRSILNNGSVDIEIYNGHDLTENLAFDTRADQVLKSTYLISNETEKNVAYFMSKSGQGLYYNPPYNNPVGLDRRVVFIDQSNDDATSDIDARRVRALIELSKHAKTAVFDGELAVNIADLYDKPQYLGGYSLGDVIQLRGKYGLYQNTRVVEFIRSMDANGTKAYPTFETVAGS